jgi:hypothetical protein
MHHVAYKMMTLVAIRGPALPVTPKLALLFPLPRAAFTTV